MESQERIYQLVSGIWGVVTEAKSQFRYAYGPFDQTYARCVTLQNEITAISRKLRPVRAA